MTSVSEIPDAGAYGHSNGEVSADESEGESAVVRINERGDLAPTNPGVALAALPKRRSPHLAKRSLEGDTERIVRERKQSGPRNATTDAAARTAARGLEAEDCLADLVSRTRGNWQITRNVRDKSRRETDILVSRPNVAWHIEVKSLRDERLYWSRFEFEKAEQYSGYYLMALLAPSADPATDYRIYWSWDPLRDLLACERRVDWVWDRTIPGPVLPKDTWRPLQERSWPDEPPGVKYVVRIQESFLAGLTKDTVELTSFWSRLNTK